MHPEQPAAPGPPPRPRARRAVAAAVVTVAAAVAAVTPAVAFAAPGPISSCVISKGDGTFRAVFRYSNSGQVVTVPRGPANRVSPDFLDGIQPTTFKTGTGAGEFATPYVAKNYRITWTLSGMSTTASWRDEPCGSDVILPTEGNAIGPILVLVLSMLFSFMLNALRTWRQRRRSA